MHLEAPWPVVRSGLGWAMSAAYLALPLYVLFLCVDLVARPVAQAGDRQMVVNALVVLALAQLLPILIHTVGQIICTAAPVAYGGQLAATSAWLLGLGAVGLTGLLLPDLKLYAAVGGGGMMLLSFTIWLRFLSRLGERLEDRSLIADAGAYSSWFWIGFVVGVVLLGGSALVLARGGVGGELGWFGRAGTGFIGLLLLIGYAVLLRTASLAVARRGPVKHTS
jgi:hypothetical protein